MNRKLWLLAALATVAPISAGCGSSGPSGTGTANGTGTTNGTGSTGTGKNATGQDKAVKFAKCMRSNGVSEFPDPGASGKLTIDAVANGSSLNTSTPAFKQAISACKNLEPAGFMGSKRSSQQQLAALKFAQCIRENGVKDFPDPANGQPLVDTYRIPSSNTSAGMTILNAAMHKCGSVLAEAAAGQ